MVRHTASIAILAALVFTPFPDHCHFGETMITFVPLEQDEESLAVQKAVIEISKIGSPLFEMIFVDHGEPEATLKRWREMCLGGVS